MIRQSLDLALCRASLITKIGLAKSRSRVIFDEKQRAVQVPFDPDRRRQHARELTPDSLQSGRLRVCSQLVPMHACDGDQTRCCRPRPSARLIAGSRNVPAFFERNATLRTRRVACCKHHIAFVIDSHAGQLRCSFGFGSSARIAGHWPRIGRQ